MISVKNLTVKKEDKTILNQISVDFRESKTWFLEGANGSGKSTLANLIIGNKPTSLEVDGFIEYQNQNLLDLKPYEIFKLGFFMTWQNPPELTGVNLANLAKQMMIGDKTSEIINKIYKTLEIVGLSREYLKRDLGLDLSGGERKKLELALLLLAKPKLVILDELDSGLDKKTLEIIPKIRYSEEYSKTTWVIITHREELKARFEDYKSIELKNGSIVI